MKASLRSLNRGQSTLTVLGVLFALVAVIGLSWVLLANDTAQRAVFEPMREDIRRETFKNSAAFRDGMAQELRAMQFDYYKASDDHKAALRQVILHKATSIDEEHLPQDLQVFLREVRNDSMQVKVPVHQ